MAQNDVITTRDGGKVAFRFLGHGSLGIEHAGKVVYLDPVSMFHDYSSDPKADIILITHDHYDHYDPAVIEMLSKSGTEIVLPRIVKDQLGKGTVMNNGDNITIGGWLGIEAIPAYNLLPERQQFHPNNGQNNGYLLTIGGTRIYVSGDTEPTDEMKALKDIDIAFLAMNQPYTMTVDQAAEAALAIKPAIFYPYHYGGSEEKTDVDQVAVKLKDSGIDVRIRAME